PGGILGGAFRDIKWSTVSPAQALRRLDRCGGTTRRCRDVVLGGNGPSDFLAVFVQHGDAQGQSGLAKGLTCGLLGIFRSRPRHGPSRKALCDFPRTTAAWVSQEMPDTPTPRHEEEPQLAVVTLAVKGLQHRLGVGGSEPLALGHGLLLIQDRV